MDRLFLVDILLLLPLLALIVVGKNDTKSSVYIMGIIPYTGGIWNAGAATEIAIEIALELINKDERLLKGYELKIIYEDGRCAVVHSFF